jgi:hypothetical protein
VQYWRLLDQVKDGGGEKWLVRELVGGEKVAVVTTTRRRHLESAKSSSKRVFRLPSFCSQILGSNIAIIS